MDILSRIDAMKRPRLLINAARIGSPGYQRELHLSRYLGASPPAETEHALVKLIEVENDINAARMTQAAHYSVSRHVDVLIAIMGEARLLRASKSGPRPDARDPNLS